MKPCLTYGCIYCCGEWEAHGFIFSNYLQMLHQQPALAVQLTIRPYTGLHFLEQKHGSLPDNISLYGNPNQPLPNVWKPGTPTLKPRLWKICCESYMTQIWHVCVCLLKLSLLYPAPHMDTAMLRISLSFLTKPSEQLAKNNMTCCLRFGLRPPGEDITRGEELIWFETRLTLASMAATNSKHRPVSAASPSCTRGQRDGEKLGGRVYIFGTFFLFIIWPNAGQRAFQVIFWHKTCPDSKLKRVHPSTGPSRFLGMSPELHQ